MSNETIISNTTVLNNETVFSNINNTFGNQSTINSNTSNVIQQSNVTNLNTTMANETIISNVTLPNNSTLVNNNTFGNQSANSSYPILLNCTGHGEFNSILGTCSCYSNVSNGFWKGQYCDQCQFGYYGFKCLTQIIGPATLFNTYLGIKFTLNGPSTDHQKQIIDCSKLIDPKQFSLFGTNPICSWNNQSSTDFTIQFSSDYSYSILPGTILSLNRFVFDNTNQTDYEQVVVILDNLIPPVVLLNGKKNIGFCETFTLDGSKSYSLDRKPLKFYWTLISSPLNPNLDLYLSNSSILEMEPENMKDPGEYKIGLQVQSTLTGMKSDLNIWNFNKASIPLPIISIIGEKEINIQKSELPIVIKKTVEIPSCFYSNTSMNIEWKQISGPLSNLGIDSSNNMAIISVSGLLESTYEFKVSATSIVNPLSTTYEYVNITIAPSPLSLQVNLDSLSTDTASISIEFTDPDQTIENEQWNWSCKDITRNTTCGTIVDNYLLASANEKLSTLEINSNDLKKPSELLLTLSVTKGSRVVTDSITISFSNNILPPIISLISVSPKTSYIPSNDIINLQLLVSISNDSPNNTTTMDINKYITREWTLNSQPLTSGNSLLSLMTIDPSETNSIVIDTAGLKFEIEYQLSLKVTDTRNSLNSTYIHTFTITSPPTPCPCTITPSSGVAFQTTFTFNCQTCVNSQGNIIQTTYGFIDYKSGAAIALKSQVGIMSTKLPYLSNNIITTYIKFTDPQSGAFSNLRYDITINLPAVKSVIEIKKLVASWTSIQNSLQDGDPAKMVYNSGTISSATNALLAQLSSKRVLNVCKNGVFNEEKLKCQCFNGFAKSDCSIAVEELELYQEIRGSLTDDLVQSFESRNPYETITNSFLTVQVYGIDSLTRVYDELNLVGFNKCLNLFKKLISASNFKPGFKLPFGVDVLMSNIIKNMYNYLEYVEMDTSIIYDLTKSFSLLETWGMFVGQKDYQLSTSFATLLSNKIFRLDFALKSFALPTNTIKLPSTMPLSQKSDRKPISFIFISSVDLFGIGKIISRPSITFNNSLPISSSNITSTKFIRSEILNFELLDANILDIPKEIEYKIKYFSLQNYTYNSLISSKNTSSENRLILTNIYKTSEFLCISFNITDMKENSCILTNLSFGIATCKCQSTTNVIFVENVIERVETILQNINSNQDDEQNTLLAIILGSILGFSCCLCSLLVLLACIKLIMNLNHKSMPPNNVEMKSAV